MIPQQAIKHLRRANEVAARAMSLGRHPFGAILVAPDGETVLAEQGNVDVPQTLKTTHRFPGRTLFICPAPRLARG